MRVISIFLAFFLFPFFLTAKNPQFEFTGNEANQLYMSLPKPPSHTHPLSPRHVNGLNCIPDCKPLSGENTGDGLFFYCTPRCILNENLEFNQLREIWSKLQIDIDDSQSTDKISKSIKNKGPFEFAFETEGKKETITFKLGDEILIKQSAFYMSGLDAMQLGWALPKSRSDSPGIRHLPGLKCVEDPPYGYIVHHYCTLTTDLNFDQLRELWEKLDIEREVTKSTFDHSIVIKRLASGDKDSFQFILETTEEIDGEVIEVITFKHRDETLYRLRSS